MTKSLKPHHQQASALTILLTTGVTLVLIGLGASLGLGIAKWMQTDSVSAAQVPATLSPVATTTVEPATPVPTFTPAPTLQPSPTPIPPTPLPAAYLIAGNSHVNVRTGPDLHYEKIGALSPGDQAIITGVWGNWWQIMVEDRTAWVSGDIVTAYDAGNVPVVDWIIPSDDDPQSLWVTTEERWIDVDLSQQMLTAYEGQTMVKQYLISTGLPATPTPTGQYRIWIKLRYDDMSGPGYYIPNVPYVMYFYLGYGLHGVTWHGNFGHPMSHGCVNQPTEMAEWLFGFAEEGTLVNIHN